MTLLEILTEFRARTTDTSAPYLWSDAELVGYLNEAINEAAEEAWLFKDSLTAAICQKTILAIDATPSYALDSRVLRVLSARIVGQSQPLIRKFKIQMDSLYPGWESATPATPRFYLTDYSEGYITLYPKSSANATLAMTVMRLPKDQMSLGSMSASPEIHFRYHRDLVDGMLARAYNKEDSETLDPQKAQRHLGYWKSHLERMKLARIHADWSEDQVLASAYGAI